MGFVLTAGLYELGYEFEDKGPRGSQCIESDANREQDPRGTIIELGYDLRALFGGPRR